MLISIEIQNYAYCLCLRFVFVSVDYNQGDLKVSYQCLDVSQMTAS